MTPLDHALAYAALGWRVVPIPPGHKYPHGIDDWQDKATTDPARIRRHWGKHPDHGIGIATGPGSGIVAIDVDTYAGGDLADLEALIGPLPDTVEAVTGRGGRHLLFAHPIDSMPITNAAHMMPVGIDVRGDGGQIVVAPTVHPDTGVAYAWEVEHDPLDGYPVAEMPAALVALLRAPAPEQAARRDVVPYAGDDSIVDLFASRHTWPELLEADGWTLHSRRASYDTGEIYELWTRPGKDPRAGASASLYYRGSDVLKVFSSSCAPLESGRTYTRFGYWATMRHGGDMVAAGRAYRRSVSGSEHRAEAARGESDIGGGDSTPDVASAAPDPRPAIVHNGRQLDDVVHDALLALALANAPPELFVRAGRPARLRQDEEHRPVVDELRPEHVRHHLSTAATWWRSLKDGGCTATSPPLDVSATILAAGRWPFPALAGVVELPVLRPDGSFHVDHGYDPATKLYHWHKGDPYRAIPDAPTPAELAGAVALIDELLCDFPWDTAADRANAWALMLTPLVRAVVGQVPMALIDAPEPGTGKGLLVKVATIVTTGRSAALMAWPTSEEELEKKVTSVLMGGSTVVVFDNVEGIIKSPTLAAVLTADHWQGRTLGRSEVVSFPNRATWAATGNNIDVGGDLARRCYRIRLDARQARPWLRTGFAHPDLEGWATQRRGDLLHALCTIVRSWWTAGRPHAADLPAMGGYSSWVGVIGGILEHAGVGHFLANLAEFHASADRDAQSWEAFLTAWADRHGEQPLTVAELIAAMADIYTGQHLRDVLPDELSGYWDTPGFSRRLSLALRKRAGRHYGPDGLHLVEMPRDRRNVAVYSVTDRSVTLFEEEDGVVKSSPSVRKSAGVAREFEQLPRGDGPLTSDDAIERGSAEVVPPPNAMEKLSTDMKIVGYGDPTNFRTPHTPARADDDVELF